MQETNNQTPTNVERAIQTNGILWGLGNAITSHNFIYFLASDLGFSGLGLSLLLTIPNLAGVLRLFAPSLIRYWPNSKHCFIVLSLLSYSVMAIGLPLIDLRSKSAPEWLPISLIVCVGVHQALEFLAQVAQWNWYGQLVSPAERGRIFGKRQAWQLLGIIPLTIGSGAFLDWMKEQGVPQWGYFAVHVLGILLLLASIIPLAKLQYQVTQQSLPTSLGWQSLLVPLNDHRYWKFLLFRCWLSGANGISQTTQFTWANNVLKISKTWQVIGKSLMQLGQLIVSMWGASVWDRQGYRRSLLFAQLIVTCGVVSLIAGYFVPAQVEAKFWYIDCFLLAWLCWSAYAVHNVAIPNLALSYSTTEERPAYVAVHDALSSLSHAVMTIIGGLTYDWFISSQKYTAVEASLTILGIAVVLRGMTMLWIYLLDEATQPGTNNDSNSAVN
jgi:hypothetical protein